MNQADFLKTDPSQLPKMDEFPNIHLQILKFQKNIKISFLGFANKGWFDNFLNLIK